MLHRFLSKSFLIKGFIIILCILWHFIMILRSEYPTLHGIIVYGILILFLIISRIKIQSTQMTGYFLIGCGLYIPIMSEPSYTSLIELFHDRTDNNNINEPFILFILLWLILSLTHKINLKINFEEDQIGQDSILYRLGLYTIISTGTNSIIYETIDKSQEPE